MKHITHLLLFIATITLLGCNRESATTLSIAGRWSVVLDSTDSGLKRNYHQQFNGTPIELPGTTDDAALGVPDTLSLLLKRPQLTYLTRKHSYLGVAWYSREIEIPSNWEGKRIMLNLERVIWKTEVWVDGKHCNQENYSLVAPHVFDLSGLAEPGKKHRLTIKVDNRKQYEVSNGMAHAYTNHTQIIWNGLLGHMNLEAIEPTSISQINVYPDISKKQIKATVELENQGNQTSGTLTISARHKKSGAKLEPLNQEVRIGQGNHSIELTYNMGNDVALWSEASPELYELTAELTTPEHQSTKTTVFGMREISAQGAQLFINGNPLFLRGTLECSVFPFTGYPPTTIEGWNKVIGTAKAWGLNHLRFHSWCPPKAAFQAADQAGFYLQVELPIWINTIGKDAATMEFVYSEADRIIREYGNHPSFCLWSMGNEIEGDLSVLVKLVDDLKGRDPRHLYTNNTFTFQQGHGRWPEPNDEFFITQQTKLGWCRGQGVFNNEYPSFDKDYSASVTGMTVPLITHEVGQYAVFPNMDEIKKYTGVLDPLNFKSIQADLEKKGLLQKANDYTKASGRLAVILYKEEIERALKTAGIAGFQLLGLNDFPGQGTALVGLLDAFWDSKGFIEADEFRGFCAPVVPLARFPKATYKNSETFEASIDVSNYSEVAMGEKTLNWSIVDLQKTVVASGSGKASIKQGYNHNRLHVNVPLSIIANASQLTFTVAIDGTTYKNNWNIWVYPSNPEVNYGDVHYTRNTNDALEWLKEGKTVLLNPDWQKTIGLEGKFVPVFWSPVHFPHQAGTMGLLCNPEHPALKQFPTSSHTDWQWWDLCINSTTLIVDSLQGGQPIVEVIDNFVNNRRLAMIFEGKVGNGKLVVATCDLSQRSDMTPESKQMLVSLLDYMNSNAFSPPTIQNVQILDKMVDISKGDGQKSSPSSVY
jgi:hypothetical protein